MCRPARMTRGRSSRSSIQRVSAGDPASRISSVPASRSARACASLVGSSTAPWASSPTWQWASTRPGRTQPETVWTSAPGCGAEYDRRPSTTHTSSRTASGPTRTCPLTCSTGALMARPYPAAAGRAQRRSAVLGVEVEALPLLPRRALVAPRRDAAGVADHLRQVHEVPRHERGVAVGEVVLRPAGARVEVGRAGPDLADPARVGLRRDHVAEVLHAVEDVARAVLDPVLVAGDQRTADPAVEGVLPPLDDPLGDAGVVPQPDRPGHHEDVRGLHPWPQLRPLVGGPAVPGHVGVDA